MVALPMNREDKSLETGSSLQLLGELKEACTHIEEKVDHLECELKELKEFYIKVRFSYKLIAGFLVAIASLAAFFSDLGLTFYRKK